REAVVGTSRTRVLGGLAVIGRHDGDAVGLGHVEPAEVHHLRRAGDHAAAVEVEVHRARGAVGRGDAAAHPGDLAVDDVGRDVEGFGVALALGTAPAKAAEPRAPDVARLGPHRFDLVGPQSESGHGTATSAGAAGVWRGTCPARTATTDSVPIPYTAAANHTSTPIPGRIASTRRMPQPRKNADQRFRGGLRMARPRKNAPAT